MNLTPPFSDHQVVAAQIAGRPIQLEVVVSPAAITQGLSGRSQLGQDGMLFILGAPRIPRFWMRGMRFDLDLVWLLDYRVIDTTENVPHPDSSSLESQLPTYSPQRPANQVLELPAGTVKAWGVAVGDQLEIK